MLTTAQAAERLGVSSRRVLALIEAGDLTAERFGRSWMIDERSVEERARMPRISGRPKMGQKRLMSLKSYTLMNRNHAVFDFVYDDERKRVSIGTVHEGAAWAPLGCRNGRSQAKCGRLCHLAASSLYAAAASGGGASDACGVCFVHRCAHVWLAGFEPFRSVLV